MAWEISCGKVQALDRNWAMILDSVTAWWAFCWLHEQLFSDCNSDNCIAIVHFEVQQCWLTPAIKQWLNCNTYHAWESLNSALLWVILDQIYKLAAAFSFEIAKIQFYSPVDTIHRLYLFKLKLVYALIVLTALIYSECCLIERALVYTEYGSYYFFSFQN